MGDTQTKEAKHPVPAKNVESYLENEDFDSDGNRSTGVPNDKKDSLGHSLKTDLMKKNRVAVINKSLQFLQSRETLKEIYLKLPDGSFHQIEISQDDNITVGWIYSEYLRQIMAQNKSNKGTEQELLCSENKDYQIDYILTDFSESTDNIPAETKIVPYKGYKIDASRSIDFRDLQIIKNIGTGGFSKVFLVKRLDNGQFYALKVLEKKSLVKTAKEEYAFNEKKLLAKLNHKFINNFQFSFQTDLYLCFGLEYCPGGSLYELLKRYKTFDEQTVRICISQIVLAMEYLHSRGVLYRDLKAENVLIDKRGNIKLCDFGLSKKVKNIVDLNETFCGSPDYLSPEVIKKKGYNYLRDIFSVGVLAFELLHGYAPFVADTIKETYENILQSEVVFSKDVSQECKDFILDCLQKNPKVRLGSKNQISDVLNHHWIRTAVYNIKADLFRFYPFEKYIANYVGVSSTSPTLNFLNDWFHEDEHNKSTGENKFFDFSFRKSTDQIAEFPLLDNNEIKDEHNLDKSYDGPPPLNKIRMANSIKFAN